MVKKKILITDAKVPLLWLRNKDLRTQPFVQTRVHGICKLFDPDEMYYIKSKDNPADIGTKFDNFKNTYKILRDDSLFRQGPRCLRLGVKEAVRRNELIPIEKISPTSEEKDSAALEVVKLHQLVITENQNENLTKAVEPADALDEEEIDDAVACLITMNNDTIENESWLSKKSSGYRAQKATMTVKERVSKVEVFSNYLVSPLRKRYDVFFRSTMCTFKAIRCWLKTKLTNKAPKDWDEKRKEIDERILKLMKSPKQEATIE